MPASLLEVTYRLGAGAVASINPDPAIAFIAITCAFDSTCRQMGIDPQDMADVLVKNCQIIESHGGPISSKVQ